ncbi:MAG TPA: hypothetical protein VD907_03905 [Verrucomicrobiae bacterium]|nr:hypothetical protein [Verrucomicrobiae bacterium]
MKETFENDYYITGWSKEALEKVCEVLGCPVPKNPRAQAELRKPGCRDSLGRIIKYMGPNPNWSARVTLVLPNDEHKDTQRDLEDIPGVTVTKIDPRT